MKIVREKSMPDTNIMFYTNCISQKEISNSEEIKFITLLPNLEIDEIKQKFNNILANEMENYSNFEISDPWNKQQIINDMYLQITTAIQFAFNSCSGIISVKNLNKTKRFTNELKEIKSKLVTIKD